MTSKTTVHAMIITLGALVSLPALADPPPAADNAPPPAAPAAPPEYVYPEAGTAEGGAVGFWRVTSADAGKVNTLRFDLRGAVFGLNKFPIDGNDVLLTGELSLAYTFFKGMEVFGAYDNSSNSNTVTIPSVVQAEGDIVLGIKVGGYLGPIQLAGDVRFDLKNGFGDDYPTVKSSDMQLSLLMTYLTGGFQMDFQFGGLIGRDVDALSPYVNGAQGGLLFGSRISAYDQLFTSLLFRYNFKYGAPLLGFDFDIPLGITAGNLGTAHTNLGDATAKRLALGARFFPGAGNAIDVMLVGGLGTEVVGWARTEPWLLAAAYSFALDPSIYKPAPPPPPPPPPPPAPIWIGGTVTDAATGAAVAGAVVTPESSLPVATGPDGAFRTRDLKGGPTQIHVERQGFQPTDLQANAQVGGQPLAIKLTPSAPPPPPAPIAPPPAAAPPPTGYLSGALLGPQGGLAADVKITGTFSQELRTNSDGTFNVRLPAGPYDVVVMADGFFARGASVIIGTDQAQTLLLHTKPTPKRPSATLDGDKVKLAKPIVLNEKRAAPTQAELLELAEVADLVVRNPEKQLVIAVSSDLPAGQTADRTEWTEARANAIRGAVIAQGAPASRVEARGLGTTTPLAPQGSRQAALKNRRVDMTLIPLPPKRVLSIHPVAPGSETAPPPFTPPPPPPGDMQDLPPLK